MDRIKGRADEKKIEQKIARAIEDGYMTIRDLSVKHSIPFRIVNLVISIAEGRREITRRIRQEWYVNEEQFLHYHKKFQEFVEKLNRDIIS